MTKEVVKVWQCELCERTYGTENRALACEDAHPKPETIAVVEVLGFKHAAVVMPRTIVAEWGGEKYIYRLAPQSRVQ